jgi:surface antigen
MRSASYALQPATRHTWGGTSGAPIIGDGGETVRCMAASEAAKRGMQYMEGSMTTLSHAWRGMLVSTMLIAFLLMGCESTGPRTAVGGLGGAAAGGLLAAALGGEGTAIAAVTILGGLLGGAIGERLDAADRQRANAAAAQALEAVPSGQSVTWRNPDSGNAGTVTPVRTYQTATGQYCREYTQTINVGGERHQSYGTACRQPDGTWRIVS